MSARYHFSLPVAAGILIAAPAAAEWRCDCTTITDSCEADVLLADEFVEVTTDVRQCARVDYFLDGLPFVAVVVDGRQRQDWISRGGEPNVLVQSCQVCRDRSDDAASAQQSEAESADGEPGVLEPLIEVMPSYPEAAESRGVAGHVVVEFTVTPLGEVAETEVTESQPPGVFDQAAVAAIQRWRYPQDADRPAQRLTQRLEFSPGVGDAARPRAGDVVTEGAVNEASGVPVNQCVREDAVYNYGEMIEVGLMNACSQPLAVYACAQGVGPRQGRWHCADSDSQQRLLVPQNDARAGETVTSSVPGGLRGFRYADAFFLTRAPNTQYWWLACRESDTACRADAREWVRSLDGQLARIDPQLRSRTRIARSH